MKESCNSPEHPDAYQPINCDFYDHFEIHAMRQTWLKITFIEASELPPLITKIKTLLTEDKEEFAVLIDDRRIRLDLVSELLPMRSGDTILSQILDKLDFNRWADNEIFSVIKGHDLTEEIRLAISHNFNALDIWIHRMNGSVSSTPVWQEHDRKDWSKLFDQAFFQILNLINQKEISEIIAYKNLEGTAHQASILDILTHLVNHSTYHRGQVIKLLQKEGLPTLSTDFINYTYQRKN